MKYITIAEAIEYADTTKDEIVRLIQEQYIEKSENADALMIDLESLDLYMETGSKTINGQRLENSMHEEEIRRKEKKEATQYQERMVARIEELKEIVPEAQRFKSRGQIPRKSMINSRT